MKKNSIIILVLVVVVIAGIVFFASKSNEGEKITPSNQTIEEETETEEIGEAEEEAETESIDSLSLGGSYRCVYTIEDGAKVTTYVKGDKMRTEIFLEGGDTNIALYTDDKVYQWSDKKKEGFFMPVEEAKEQQGTEVQDPDEYLIDIKSKYEVDCKNVDVADDLFMVPRDINFQDLSQLLNQ